MPRIRIACLVLFVCSSVVSAQETPSHFVSGYVGIGGGGDARLDEGFANFDLDPSASLGVRYEFAPLEFLSVGAAIQWTSWGADDRNSFIDISPLVRGRYGFDVGERTLELHASVLLGMTIAPLNDELADDSGLGLNLGGFVGATFFATERVGVIAEIGIEHHRINVDDGNKFTLKTTQAMSHVGVVVGF